MWQKGERISFYKMVFAIMIPLVLQNAISYALATTDSVMVGLLGENELSAVGIAGQVFFMFFMICMGIASGSSLLLSQYYGKKDFKSINSIAGFSLFISVLVGAIFFAGFIFIPRTIMRLFTNQGALIELGAKFLRASSYSYLFFAVSYSLALPLRAAGETKIPLLLNSIGFVLNTIFNYFLIFGSFGFPKLGVTGAAISTSISRGVTMLFTIWYIFYKDKKIRLCVKQMLHQNINLIKDLMKFGTPALINDMMWGVGTSMFTMIFGRLGVHAVAAYNIVSLADRFVFIIIGGLGISAAVIIGKELGASSFDLAKKYAKQLIKDAVIVGIFVSIITIVIAKPLIFVFNFSKETSDLAFYMILILSLFVILKSVNFLLSIGTLRSGGDTLYCAVSELSALFFIAIPLCALAAFVFKVPVHFVYICTIVNELFAFVFFFYRYKKMKWIKNVTR